MRDKHIVWEELRLALEFLNDIIQTATHVSEVEQAREAVERLYEELTQIDRAEHSRAD